MTFEWEDITGKVLFAAYRADDMVTAITEDGREYLFEFGEPDTLENQREILERFLGEYPDISECDNGSEQLRETERWLYKWLPFAYIFVKKDFFEKFFSEFEKQSVKRYLTAFDTAKKLLDPQNELPRMIIRQKRQPEKWEALTSDEKIINDLNECLKKTERELSENKLKSMSWEEFKAHSDAFMAELEKNKEPEPVILTFEWEDITDEVIEKFVFVEFKRADIHFPCYITAITDEGREYFAELNEREKEDDMPERFLGDDTDLDRHAVPKDTKGFHVSGKWLYKRVYTRGSALQIFVRKDFFDRFISVYEKRDEDLYSALDTARKLLNPECKQPRMVHSKTMAEWEL